MSSKNVGIEEARRTLGDLVTAAQQGADIVLTRNGKPAARIVAQEATVTDYEYDSTADTLKHSLRVGELMGQAITGCRLDPIERAQTVLREEFAHDSQGSPTMIDRTPAVAADGTRAPERR